nr:WD40 repeat domain-containing protein [Nitrosomonas nitrosa]
MSKEAVGRLATAPSHRKANRRWRWTVGVVTICLLTLVVLLVKQNIALDKAIRKQIGLRLNVDAQQKGNTESRLIGRLAGYRLSPEPEILNDLGKEYFRLSYVDKLIGSAAMKMVTASFSRRDNRIVSLSKNGQLHEFDAHTGREVSKGLVPSGLEVRKWAMGCNGASTAFVSVGGSLWLWEAENQAFHQMQEETEALITSLVFNRDCSSLASGSLEGRIQIWDTKTRQLRITSTGNHHSFNDHPAIVEAIGFSPHAKFIASGGGDGAVRLWDATTLQEIAPPLYGSLSESNYRPVASLVPNAVTTVAISPDGAHIISAGRDNKVYVWSANSWQLVGQPWDKHDSKLEQVAFSRDGKRLVSRGENGEVLLWSVVEGRLLHRFSQLPLRDVLLDEDGGRILGVGDGMIWVVNTEAAIADKAYDGAGWHQILSLSFDPMNKYAVTAHEGGLIRLLDSKTFKEKKLTRVKNPPVALAFRHDGERFVSGDDYGQVLLWNVTPLEPIGRPLKTDHGEVRAVAFSPDGNVIATTGADGVICFWDAQTQDAVGLVDNEARDEPLTGINSLSYNPNHKEYIVSGGDDGRIRVWDTNSFRALDRYPMEHTGRVMRVAVSPDGDFIASGGDDGALRLWDQKTGRLIRSTKELNILGIRSLSYSPDGSFIVAVGGSLVVFWDVQTGYVISYPIEAKNKEKSDPGDIGLGLMSVAFSPDGQQFVAGGSHVSTMIGPTPQRWPTLLCQKLVLNMTQERWREIVSPDIDYIPQCHDLLIPPDGPERQSTARGT